MPVLIALLAGLFGALVSQFLPLLLGASSGWSVRVKGWFGWIRLAYVRASGAAVFGIAASTAISLSTSNESHQFLTYLLWWGLALSGLGVAVYTTILIDRSGTAPPEPTTVARVRPGHSTPTVQHRADRVIEILKRNAIEKELVAIIDEWKVVRGNAYSGTHYGTYNLWEQQTSSYIEDVLGPIERQRFQSNDGESNASLERQAELRINALELLRDNPDRWKTRSVERAEIAAAGERRRELSPADEIVLAGGPLLSYLHGEDQQAGSGFDQRVGLPQLSFGRAHISQRSQPLGLDANLMPAFEPFGRIIRVPVTNARGAVSAEAVAARLDFLPDDRQGSFSPRDPIVGEWDGSPPQERIEIPGNGQPHLLNVAVVTHGPYPFVYPWSRHTREAHLNGYGVSSSPIDIEITVSSGGAGERAQSISDTLQVDVRDGILRADWRSHVDEATNWVAMKIRHH